MTLTVTERVSEVGAAMESVTLALTAEERQRSRHYFETEAGEGVYLHLPRGTVLKHGDVLATSQGDRTVTILAKPEPILRVTAHHPLDLLRAAYHLGNRHVALEVTETHLSLSPDPVLQTMLEQLGLQVEPVVAPFQPETGAYGHHH